MMYVRVRTSWAVISADVGFWDNDGVPTKTTRASACAVGRIGMRSKGRVVECFQRCNRPQPPGVHRLWTPLFRGTDARHEWATRSLRKQPGFTALALLTLALGVGATTTAFTVLDTVLLRPLPYEGADRLVLLRERAMEGRLIAPSYPNFSDWRDQAKSFSGVASESFAPCATVSAGPGSEPVRVATMGVSRRFFTILGVRQAVGREFSVAENRRAGRTLSWCPTSSGGCTWGPPPARNDSLGQDRGASRRRAPGRVSLHRRHRRLLPARDGAGYVRNAHNYRVIARLAPNATLATARAEMTAISRNLKATYGDDTQAVDVDVAPLRDYLVGDYRLMLAVVFGAAAMVLLIACTNLVSAQLARGLARQREVAVRAALGASRGRLVTLLFAETAMLVVVGSALGAGVAFC